MTRTSQNDDARNRARTHSCEKAAQTEATSGSLHAARGLKPAVQRFFAFLLTALFVFEAVPAIAYAEAGEALANAAEAAIGELLDEQNDGSQREPLHDDPADVGEGFEGEPADGETAEGDQAPADDGIAPISELPSDVETAAPASEGDLCALPTTMNLYKKPAGSADWVQVNKKDDGSDENIAEVGSYYQLQKLGEDNTQQWRIEIEAPEGSYESVKVSDVVYSSEWEETSRSDETLSSSGEQGGRYSYEWAPGTNLRYIEFTFSQAGKTERTVRVITWPTMSWEYAYGYADDDGVSSINGLTSDYWVALNPFDILDNEETVNIKTGPFRAFTYDPDLTTKEGVPVFSSKPVEKTVKSIYKATFMANQNGTLSFDLCFPSYYSRDIGVTSDKENAIQIFSLYVRKNGEWIRHQSGSTNPDHWASSTVKNVWQTITLQDVQVGDKIELEFSRFTSSPWTSVVTNNVYAAIKNLSYSDGDATLKLATSGSGTVTANGKALSAENKFGRGNRVTLVAQPASGWTFAGWYDLEEGKLLGTDTTYAFPAVKNRNIKACLAQLSAAALVITQDAEPKTYADLSEALEASETSGEGTQVIALATKSTFDKNATVPKGVTFLLPLSASDRTGLKSPGAKSRVAWNDGVSPYSTLSISGGATLTVEGTLVVGGTRLTTQQTVQGITSGDFAKVENSGSILIQSGGVLDVNGLITGTGSIESKSGSTVKMPYTVNDFEGGTNTQELYYKGDFPFHQYATPNTQCKLIVNGGSELIGTTSLYLNSMDTLVPQDVPLVAEDEGLILLPEGSKLTATYDQSKSINEKLVNMELGDFGKQTLTLYGDAALGGFNISGYGSSNKYLCLPYNFDLVVASGKLSIKTPYSYRIMPGATVTINEGATLDVGGSAGLDVANGWNQTKFSRSQYPTSELLGKYGFSKTGNLVVNGTLNLNAGSTFTGIVQTTATTGKAVVANGALLSKTYNVGAKTTYGDSTASYASTGRIHNGIDLENLKAGQTYSSLGDSAWTLESYTMGSIVAINQDMHGSWGVPRIVYHYNNGDGDKTVTPEPGSTVTLENPTPAEGMVFDGWYTTKTFEGEPVGKTLKTTGGTIELWAKWSVKTYKLSFDPDGGTFTSPAELASPTDTYETTVEHAGSLEMPTVERLGYEFLGWYEGSQKVDQLVDVRADHALKASWQLETYDIAYAHQDEVGRTLDAEGVSWGNAAHPTSYTVDDAVEVGTPTRTGYTFAGWTWPGQDAPQQTVSIPAGRTGKLTLTAHWTAISFDITFNPGEGTLQSPEGEPLDAGYTLHVTYGQPYNASGDWPQAVREGATFDGWQLPDGTKVNATDKVAITEPAKFKATWSYNGYTLGFNLAGGSWPSGNENFASEHANYTVETPSYHVPQPERTGYVFLGWSGIDAEPVKDVTIPPERLQSLSLTAEWQAKTVQVKLDANGGQLADGVSGLALTYGKTVEGAGMTIPTPTRLGYTFDGWYFTDADKAQLTASTEVNFTEERTAEARWAIETYDIEYVFSEGDGFAEADVAKAPKTYTVETAFELPKPQRTGHTFKQWTAVQELGGVKGEGTILEQGVVHAGTTGRLTFKADSTSNWTVNQHQLTWDYNYPDGTQKKDEKTLNYGATFNAPEDPELSGYAFDGWDDGTGELRKGAELQGQTMPDANVTFTAKWADYLAELNAIPGFSDAGQLARARELYALLNDAQKSSYDASPAHDAFIKAIEAHEAAALDAEVKAAISTVNGTLSDIAELSLDPKEEHVVKVKILDPHTKAKDMLTIGFLTELFGSDRVDQVDVEGQVCGKDQMSLMEAVAWAAYGKSHYATTQDFYQWLIENQNTLEIAILLGTSVHANLLGTTDEGAKIQSGYTVQFWDDDHEPGEVKLVTLTYDTGEGGSTVPSTTLRPGELLSRPNNPSRTGYTFVDWYVDPAFEGEPYAFSTMPEEDLTLHAKWEPNRYSVAFAAGRAGTQAVTGALPESWTNVAYDEVRALPECEINVVGYEFAGWKDEASSAGTLLQPGESVSKLTATDKGSVTLTAQWTAKTHTITFDANEGEMPADAPNSMSVAFDARYDSASELKGAGLPRPTRDGYEFAGWRLGSETGPQVNDETPLATDADHTLVATWIAKGDTLYRTYYHLQNIENDEYALEGEPVEGHGATDSRVKADEKTIPGFQLVDKPGLTVSEGTITGDGTLELHLYYDRIVYDVTYEIEGREPETRSFRYGAPLTAPNPARLDDDSASYEFLGWENSAKDVLSSEELAALTASANETYTATYKENHAVAVLGEKGEVAGTYRTLEAALASAKSGDTLRLDADATLTADATVPKGVTLVLPYEADDAGYEPNYLGEPFGPDNPVAGEEAARPFRTLTVAGSATLKVDGTLLVNALTGYPAAGHHDQVITGGWALLQADGRVLVSAGGTLENFGRVRGAGSVRALAGGTVGDLFVVRNWRGGSQALAMYSALVYPYNEYDCKNIETPLTIEAGGTLTGLVKMYADGGYYSTRFPLVDPANGLMRQKAGGLGEHRVTRTIEADGGERYEVVGDTELSRSTLTIVGVELSTGEFAYPIDGDISWSLRGGRFDFTEDYKFLPGALVQAWDADVTVAEGKTVVFYQKFDDRENTAGTEYPSRDAALLILDPASTLTNYGSFAGNVTALGPNVREGRLDVSWDVETSEANGYFDWHPMDETRPIRTDLLIRCPGHTYEVSRYGEILWDGEASRGAGGEIAQIGDEGAEDLTILEPGLTVTTETAPAEGEGEGSEVTWTIDVAGPALEAPAGETTFSVIGVFLHAMAARADSVRMVSTLTGVEPEEVAYMSRGISDATVERFVRKLGLVDVAEANAEAREEAEARAQAGAALQAEAPHEVEALARDLAGASCRLLVTGTGEEPAEVTFTLRFTAEGEAPEQPGDDPGAEAGGVEVLRLYDTESGEHLFTTDAHEAAELAKDGRWVDEGVAWVAPTEGDEVTRLYNWRTGEHLYTKDEREIAKLTAGEWKDEGLAWHSAGAEDGVPIYRLYDAKPGVLEKASHHYTADRHEYDVLPAEGWMQERVCWYGLPNAADTAGAET